MYRWLDERLNLERFKKKYLSKVFPVHPTFFFGEIALFSFVILVLTGIYLLFSYVPSSEIVTVGGKKMPASYYSILLINKQPLGLIIRYVHHWAAHLMIAALILHMARVFFTGSFKKPREINWLVGMILFTLAILAGFTGYSLPFDALSVVATGIGYEIANSIPYVGNAIANFFFNGHFPASGSLPRLFMYHVVLLPALLSATIGLHMLIMIKQKHTQPAKNKEIVGPDKILGIPLYPQQISLMLFVFLSTTALLFFMASLLPVHNVEYFGPPTLQTPMVKPDWYLLWIYGIIKLIPGSWNIPLSATASIDPEVIGGVIAPGIILTIIALAPFFYKNDEFVNHLEPVSKRPIGTSLGVAFIVLFIVLSFTGYQAELNIPIWVCRIYTVVLPIIAFVITYLIIKKPFRS
ncbi:cytochrome b [Hippea jasoniae]|uniref:cytochrome b n=1 Tax=Hippea jasoniae TaxID=944479 RepID=UPI0005556D22|nr:cytochrome bc complex cytochrome b subunit [Hippea jasoniae]